jgi:hypothetical protein
MMMQAVQSSDRDMVVSGLHEYGQFLSEFRDYVKGAMRLASTGYAQGALEDVVDFIDDEADHVDDALSAALSA